MNTETKICSKCKETKPKNLFYIRKARPCGVSSACKVCCDIQHAISVKKNPAASKRAAKKSYNKYRPDRLARMISWWKNNPEKHKKNCARSRAKNRIKLRAKSALYLANNLDKHCVNQALRRATKLRATPPWLTSEHKKQIKEIYKNCPKGYHVDHIVPLQGKNVRGLHVPWNLQYLSAEDNIRKSNKVIFE